MCVHGPVQVPKNSGWKVVGGIEVKEDNNTSQSCQENAKNTKCHYNEVTMMSLVVVDNNAEKAKNET